MSFRATVPILLLAIALASSARATSIVPQSLDSLADGADRIVHGRVVSAVARQEGGVIATHYDVEVIEWLKQGPQGSSRTLRIRQVGGTVGDVRLLAVGIAHFTVGEEVVLLTRDYGRDGHQQVMNAWQGALRVQRPASGEPEVPGVESLVPGSDPPRGLSALKQILRARVARGVSR